MASAAFPAILLGLFLWYLIFRTSFGFKVRAVGMNPVASGVNGFPVKRLMLLAFVISGAIVGLGGAVEPLGGRTLKFVRSAAHFSRPFPAWTIQAVLRWVSFVLWDGRR